MYRYIKSSDEVEVSPVDIIFAAPNGIPSSSLDHFFNDKVKKSEVQNSLASMYNAEPSDILQLINSFVDSKYLKDPESSSPRIGGKQMNSGYEKIVVDESNAIGLESHNGSRIYIKWN